MYRIESHSIGQDHQRRVGECKKRRGLRTGPWGISILQGLGDKEEPNRAGVVSMQEADQESVVWKNQIQEVFQGGRNDYPVGK